MRTVSPAPPPINRRARVGECLAAPSRDTTRSCVAVATHFSLCRMSFPSKRDSPQEVQGNQQLEVEGGWGCQHGRTDFTADRTAATGDPSPPAHDGVLRRFSAIPKTPEPVQKPFVNEVPLKDTPTERVSESQKEEDAFSCSVAVSMADGIGALVLRTDWIVNTLDGGTRLSFLDEGNVALLKVTTGPPLPKAGDALV